SFSEFIDVSAEPFYFDDRGSVHLLTQTPRGYRKVDAVGAKSCDFDIKSRVITHKCHDFVKTYRKTSETRFALQSIYYTDGRSLDLVLDSQGLIVEVRTPSQTVLVNRNQRTGLITSISTGNLKTTYEYATGGKTLKVFNDVAGRSWRYKYDRGQRLTSAGLRGHRPFLTGVYDEEGLVTGVGTRDILTTVDEGQSGETVITDDVGRVTRYFHSTTGLLSAISDQSGNRSINYDSYYRPIGLVEEGLPTAKVEYDNEDRVTAVHIKSEEGDWQSQHIHWREGKAVVEGTGRNAIAYFNAQGQTTQLIGSLGATKFHYRGPALESIDSKRFGKVSIGRNTAGDIRSLEAYGEKVQIERNNTGRIDRISTNNDAVDFAYDEVGFRKTATNLRGEKLRQYSYDATGNVVSLQSETSPEKNIRVTLNSADRIAKAESDSGSIKIKYDKHGNPTEVIATHEIPDQSFLAEYDEQHRLQTIITDTNVALTHTYTKGELDLRLQNEDTTPSVFVSRNEPIQSSPVFMQTLETYFGPFFYDAKSQRMQLHPNWIEIRFTPLELTALHSAGLINNESRITEELLRASNVLFQPFMYRSVNCIPPNAACLQYDAPFPHDIIGVFVNNTLYPAIGFGAAGQAFQIDTYCAIKCAFDGQNEIWGYRIQGDVDSSTVVSVQTFIPAPYNYNRSTSNVNATIAHENAHGTNAKGYTESADTFVRSPQTFFPDLISCEATRLVNATTATATLTTQLNRDGWHCGSPFSGQGRRCLILNPLSEGVGSSQCNIPNYEYPNPPSGSSC
ncbi:MAG: hypothetical protein AAGB06_05250, partial [Verrucomicrobiota bacterium]